MSTENAMALANYVGTVLPQEGESFDDYMAKALDRWPDLTDAEVSWALRRAADISRREGERHLEEADRCQAELDRRRSK
jgi:hypothetical protein